MTEHIAPQAQLNQLTEQLRSHADAIKHLATTAGDEMVMRQVDERLGDTKTYAEYRDEMARYLANPRALDDAYRRGRGWAPHTNKTLTEHIPPERLKLAHEYADKARVAEPPDADTWAEGPSLVCELVDEVDRIRQRCGELADMLPARAKGTGLAEVKQELREIADA